MTTQPKEDKRTPKENLEVVDNYQMTTKDDKWLDEIILKPAHWKYDDYIKAKQAITNHINTLVIEARKEELRSIWDNGIKNNSLEKEDAFIQARLAELDRREK